MAEEPQPLRDVRAGDGQAPAGRRRDPCTLLFADVRGSTGLAEQSSATQYAALLRRFYAVGSQAVIDERGIIDKFVGDEVVALFIPAFAGPGHALAAIRSAAKLIHGGNERSPGFVGLTGPERRTASDHGALQ